MKSVLKELWRGNIYPSEAPYKSSKKERKLVDAMFEQRETLSGSLNETQKSALEKYDDIVNEYTNSLSTEAFVKGFRLGAQITFEAFIE